MQRLYKGTPSHLDFQEVLKGETSDVTGNLPHLNDPTMISVGIKVMVMLLLQYSQQWYALDQLEV